MVDVAVFLLNVASLDAVDHVDDGHLVIGCCAVDRGECVRCSDGEELGINTDVLANRDDDRTSELEDRVL